MPGEVAFINPPEAGPHAGFSHGVRAPGGDLLFLAGHTGCDEKGKIVSRDFVAQFDRALSNLLATVRQAGGKPENLVRLTIYVRDRAEYRASRKPLGEVYQRQMGKHYPAMTLVEVSGLFDEEARLELEATAVL